MHLLIGSRALAYWKPEFKVNEFADWDIIGEPFPISPDINVEWHNPNILENSKLEPYAGSYIGLSDGFMPTKKVLVVMLPGLAMIKRSHLWRDLNWDKHITQYHLHLKEHLPKDEYSKNLLLRRMRLTKEAYPQGNPKLNQSNKDFFDDAVKKKYDHDWLHELAAHYDRPLYERMKNPDKLGEAWCERDMWEDFPHEDKVKTVQEEAYVIATERFLIPNNFKYSKKLAYFTAVKKICTTLTSGWFRDFAIDNWKEIIDSYSDTKLHRIERELNVEAN
jgi:hypothetical protein